MQEKSTDFTIGHRLRRLLGLRGQSIREFSDATGIPYRTLQDYLGDKSKPGAEQLARIASAGIDVNLLLSGKARRFGYLLEIPAPADDEVYYILGDMEVLNAIDRKAKEAITGLLKEHLKDGEKLSFEELLAAYLRLFMLLADVFARSSPPINEARKAGMSVARLIDSILDASAQIAAAKLLAKSGTAE
jgi:transcriptional regulator with XRE-family HTH domain